MLIDITLKITPKMVTDAQGNEKKAFVGHLGTHFDVMDKEFPLNYTERGAVLFDVSHVENREIDTADIDFSRIEKGMFVALYTGFLEKEGYGTAVYFQEHPVLSYALIDALVEKEIAIIGVDFAGIRRGSEHPPADQKCADHGVFVVENLCNLRAVMERGETFTACTYPLNYTDMTGLPCRVVAKVEA